jgi:peptidoglycan hydrolase CwlO-like protein
MTVESLMNTFTKYVSWLYSGREWAGWELQTIAITALVLLLFILVHRRKAKAGRIVAKQIVKKPSIIGIKLDAGKQTHQESGGGSDSQNIVSVSKNNGNQKRWKETTKKWKNLQKLIEQLQDETAKYKQAEECLEQQFARLKAANEQLRQEIAGSDQIIQEPELSRLRTIGSFDKRQSRILNTSEVLAEDS